MSDSWGFSLYTGLTVRQRISRLIVTLLMGASIALALFCGVQGLEWIDRPFPGFLLNQRMVTPGVGQYHWTGPQSGLENFDKILSANGQSLSSFEELLSLVASVPIASPISYEVQRGDETFELSIATMRFSLNDFAVLYGIIFVTGWVYLALGLVVYIMKPDTGASWAFLLACLFQAVYSFISFDVVAVHTGFVRLYFVVSGLLPAAALHLSFMFPEPMNLLRRFPFIQWVPYLMAALILIPLEVFYPGPIFKAAYLCVFIYMVVAAIALIASPIATYFRKHSILAQQRAKVVLWGAVLAFPVAAFGQLGMFLGTTVGEHAIHVNFSGIPMLIFPVSITYAIAQHNLFDVDVYIKRAVGYVVMTLLVAGLYFSAQTLLQAYVLSPLLGEAAEQVYPLVFSLLIVFFFNPIFKTVQEIVDKLFFRRKFDYKETIAAVTEALTSLFKRQAIVETLIGTIRGHMFVDMAGVLLLTNHQGPLSLYYQKEEENGLDSTLQETLLNSEDPLFALVQKEQKLLTKYDIAENPEYASYQETVGPRFAELGASLVIPLLHNNAVSGLLTLGYKKSGHFYTREDVELLTTLANQGAVALENAQLVDRMKEEEQVRGNLARYLSPQIVDRVMKNDVQVNLGGSRKEVTILFSDIRNFTTISESWPPDQLVEILNEYFTAMASIIFEYQGSLDKYIGDAIVSVFGSLIPLNNPALSAVRASIAMMKRMDELNEQWNARYGLTMDIGIGVSTGEVFLGNVGSPDRMEFTVIGDTVNVASRFSGLAHAGQVLVTRETFDSLGRAVPYKALPPAQVKGKTAPLDVFEISLSS